MKSTDNKPLFSIGTNQMPWEEPFNEHVVFITNKPFLTDYLAE